MKAYHICWVSQNWINRRLDRHQPAACVRCLQVLLQVGVVVKGHPALVAHDVLGLQVDFVDVLRKVRVFAFAVGTFCLDMRVILKLNFSDFTPSRQSLRITSTVSMQLRTMKYYTISCTRFVI